MTHIPFKVSLLRLVFLLLPVTVAAQEARLSDYVDPRIGSEGLGRVFIGPSCPYVNINTGREGQQSLSANPISREVLLKAGFTSDQSSKEVLGSDD